MVRYVRSRKTSFPDELNPDKFSIQSNNNKDMNSKKCPTNVPIFQELESLFHIKKEKRDTISMNHLQQNIQFAKENNLLKIKINDLETRLNSLLKENLNLKRQNSINELQYKKCLNEQINVLEYSIFKKFDEIISMFDNIRKRENLSTDSNPLWNKYHPDNNNTSNTLLTPSKKRNRRKSMFIQNDDLPSINANSSKSSNPVLKHSNNLINENVSDTYNCKSIDMDEHVYDNIRSSSILEHSIPEEEDEEEEEEINKIKQNNKVAGEISKNDQDNKLRISKVNPTTTTITTTTTTTATATNNNNNILSKSNTKKTQRKRTQKLPPKTQKIKKKTILKDDIMPNTTPNIDTNIDLDKIKKSKEKSITEEPNNEGRSLRRSTRGKVVNYKLPSLRAKMRRPTEKLVDATIVHDIHDYEVNLNKNTTIKEEPRSPSLKQIDNKFIENSKDKDTKLSNHTDEPVVNKSFKNKQLALNSNDTNLRKKTEIYKDFPQDSISFSSENSAAQDSKSDKITPNQLSRKRGINNIFDDMGDKTYDDAKKGLKLNTGVCLKMKHTFDLKVNKKLSPLTSSSSFQPPSSSKLSSGNNNTNSNGNSSNQILSDITNKNKQGKQITKKCKKKLLKTAIINDLYSDAEDLDIYDKLNKNTSSTPLSSASSSASFRSLCSSFHYQDTSNNSKENKTTSFRFSDDDLSVFDLLDKPSTNIKKLKAKNTNK